MNNLIDLSDTLKKERLSLNLSSGKVASDIGISRATLSSFENGSGKISVDVLLKMISYYGLDLCIKNAVSDKTSRLRATRYASKKDKKINRFIVFCLEQYAEHANIDSASAYKTLKDYGLIQVLKDDYEDLHGMSFTYLNYFIDEYLGVRK